MKLTNYHFMTHGEKIELMSNDIILLSRMTLFDLMRWVFSIKSALNLFSLIIQVVIVCISSFIN